MDLGKSVNDINICYTSPPVYYDLYSDLITTTSVGYHPEAYTIDAKQDKVEVHL
jgi:hypothetical protein